MGTSDGRTATTPCAREATAPLKEGPSSIKALFGCCHAASTRYSSDGEERHSAALCSPACDIGASQPALATCPSYCLRITERSSPAISLLGSKGLRSLASTVGSSGLRSGGSITSDYSTSPSTQPQSDVCAEMVEISIAASPRSTLLAMSSAVPEAMRRVEWTLSDYQVTKRLYKGAFCSVYRATCLHSGRLVALKIYSLLSVPGNTLHLIRREITLHSQLNHKNLAHLFGAFLEGNDHVVLVQEFASRGDLFGFFRRRPGGRMSTDAVAVAVLRPLLEALSYMHSRGVVHRDIKPENVLLTESWRLLVADLGLAIDLHQERAVTRAGTRGYMAPEVMCCPMKMEAEENKDRQELAYTTAADIFAVGMLAYELLTGRFPPNHNSNKPNMNTAAAAAAPAEIPDGASPPAAAAVPLAVPLGSDGGELTFPDWVPATAQQFVLAAVAADPRDRPTAAQLLAYPWLVEAVAAVVQEFGDVKL